MIPASQEAMDTSLKSPIGMRSRPLISIRLSNLGSSLRISEDGIGAVSGTKMIPSIDVIGTTSVKDASLEAILYGAYRIFEYDAK
ncbi:uncharacterized protein A4U43_C04F21290 [Asparagus officinalis]|uniref:Uncharacterized protein n=1 Tax=Asparagus officinalis TaxID=4686 RepID=A0A5P1F7B9_ASPOF|nr:uncharacterized protein A4U43_C04F21290 [Asparagus officinalis]